MSKLTNIKLLIMRIEANQENQAILLRQLQSDIINLETETESEAV